MIISGKEIAKRINRRTAEDVAELQYIPRVALLQVGSHPAIDSFVAIKKRQADSLGIELKHEKLDQDVDTERVIHEMEMLVRSESANGRPLYQGIVVQLPLPDHINTDKVLNMIPRRLDIDVLSNFAQEHMFDDGVLPPVVGAVREILRKARADLRVEKIAVIGEGKLVGRPVIAWLRAQDIDPIVVTADAGNVNEALAASTIVLTGVGKPNLITPEMINSQHLLIDAGTSESAGEVVGDISPECANICRAMTPVPGGVGPITVAILFQNLVARLQLVNDNDTE